MPADTTIQFRKGTSSEWSFNNPVLSSGEPGYDLDSNVLKIGDGQKNWSNLSPIGGDVTYGTVCSPTDSGIIGQIKIDNNFLYACIASNTWKRVSLTSWVDPPSQPIYILASPLDSSVYLSWTSPLCDGGGSVTGYHIQYSTDMSSWTNHGTISGFSSFSIISGLNNGSQYAFKLAAINTAGTGLYSTPSNSVTVSGDHIYYNTRLLLSFD